MVDPTTETDEGARSGPVIRDRRKIDPETGRVRAAYAAHAAAEPTAAEGPGADAGEPLRAAGQPASPGPSGRRAAREAERSASVSGAGGSGAHGSGSAGAGSAGSGAASAEGGAATGTEATAESAASAGGTAGTEADTLVENALADQLSADLASARSAAEERLADLQRLQAEYVNYRRRVDRDRDVARDVAVAGVLEALLPVLDDVHLARQHGDLESGPFAAIADKLESTLARLGLSRYGDPGEPFDPTVHEALLHTQAELAEGTTETTVVQILQPGYRLGERVLRAARVAVADPD